MSGITNKSQLHLPNEMGDDYTASIEFSNSCREFYRNRVKATETFKQSMSEKNTPTKKNTSIDQAMDTLRSEMASLMDQDLSLMKQLLTLNEAIEELKVKRLYYVSKDSLRASSQELHASDWSISETDMYDTDEECEKTLKCVKDRLSTSSIPVPGNTSSVSIDSSLSGDYKRQSDITIMVNGSPLKVHHGQQSSVDSGYGDDDTFKEIYTGPLEVDL